MDLVVWVFYCERPVRMLSRRSSLAWPTWRPLSPISCLCEKPSRPGASNIWTSAAELGGKGELQRDAEHYGDDQRVSFTKIPQKLQIVVGGVDKFPLKGGGDAAPLWSVLSEIIVADISLKTSRLVCLLVLLLQVCNETQIMQLISLLLTF